ncbi:uncharacterized protein EDB91DRAFT_1085712 [Suillus paluster]|uniref:uncharacterized protein n=1 Tax=Suillus paluster TaxID=48578 RepID=UPI001B8845B0|nr:uncharacterized protein EDB91DRAFT_1085712 [Suillus paluster]KAG1729489.1 hypothetical protein EDB91DRAFT_1085712 [Suillus paluster]
MGSKKKGRLVLWLCVGDAYLANAAYFAKGHMKFRMVLSIGVSISKNRSPLLYDLTVQNWKNGQWVNMGMGRWRMEKWGEWGDGRRRTGGWENRRTGEQENRRTGEQENGR